MAIRNAPFGDVLRNWRGRLSPESVGLRVDDRPRRTPGLQREELALLAGVSPDYVKRLEQGRAHPSAAVVDSLARALRLSQAEYEHMCALVRLSAAGIDRVPRHVEPGVQRVLDRLRDVPVCVYDATWTIIEYNASWAALLGDPSGVHGLERNLAWRHFCGLQSRVSHTPEQNERFEASLVGDLRGAAVRYPDDPSLTDLIDKLLARSSRFTELWEGRSVSCHREDRKAIAHPDLGTIAVDCDVLTVHGSDLHVVIYTAAADSADEDKLVTLHTTAASAGDESMR